MEDPHPTPLSTSILPPCASTIPFTWYSPECRTIPYQ